MQRTLNIQKKRTANNNNNHYALEYNVYGQIQPTKNNNSSKNLAVFAALVQSALCLHLAFSTCWCDLYVLCDDYTMNCTNQPDEKDRI